ncbi:urocortin-3 [Suricata suricatta]|uniref:Urocortin 3 n=1 Tax=Suricata suricatta TaxID=37032 RepID=A0A673UG24_SURSU|nr:urocortin-3 [Suricata suricatta]
MPQPAHFLLLLLLLLPGAARPGLSQKLYKAKSFISRINTALWEAKRSPPEGAPLLSKTSLLYLPSQDPSSGEDEEQVREGEDKKKRTFPSSGGGGAAGSGQNKYPSQAQLRGRPSQDKAKSDRRTKFTLSLDVPTNIMNILFNIAKAKNLQAKAAANAHLMAQIGRKK